MAEYSTKCKNYFNT